jgi:hypothetical protein
MRRVIFVFIGISAALMCCQAPKDKPIPVAEPCVTIDSALLKSVQYQRDSAVQFSKAVQDSLYREKACYDSVVAELQLSNYRIARAKNYVKICQRNPTQQKFLISWLRRALNMI